MSKGDDNAFQGRRVTLMGLGRFGGGVAAARWLAERGARVLATDLADADTLAASLGDLQDLIDAGRVELRLGEHREADFARAELVVANPAVPRPWQNRYLEAAEQAGVPIATEITLVLERLATRPIAVTGTAGKSTTAAMIHHVLAHTSAPSAALGGNIGGSLLPDLHAIDADSPVVLELSSAQLYWIDRILPAWSPAVAVLTGFAPNHLDWHGDLEHYRASKLRLLTCQHKGDTAVLSPSASDWPTNPGVKRVIASPDNGLPPLGVPGEHNRANAALAVAACEAVGVARRDAQHAVASFPGLPHRCRLVAEFAGVRCYDDSKSTVPDATLLAIRALADRHPTGRIHLIAGGYDKGIDLSPIAALAPSLASLLLVGATAEALAARAPGAIVCGHLDRAVAQACARAKPGDAILLSPACASWDQFPDFRARGEAFAAACAEHAVSGARTRGARA
ncbi:MAG: UDP-N-acetylmuramoyl-L-alanine--D-glutamate ligase [Planctomycetota bacterium]